MLRFAYDGLVVWVDYDSNQQGLTAGGIRGIVRHRRAVRVEPVGREAGVNLDALMSNLPHW